MYPNKYPVYTPVPVWIPNGTLEATQQYPQAFYPINEQFIAPFLPMHYRSTTPVDMMTTASLEGTHGPELYNPSQFSCVQLIQGFPVMMNPQTMTNPVLPAGPGFQYVTPTQQIDQNTARKPSEQRNEVEKKPKATFNTVCRHFVAGRCRWQKCRFLHPDNLNDIYISSNPDNSHAMCGFDDTEKGSCHELHSSPVGESDSTGVSTNGMSLSTQLSIDEKVLGIS